MGYVNEIYAAKLNMVQQKLKTSANRAGITAPTFYGALQQAQSGNDGIYSAKTGENPSLNALAAGYSAALSVSLRANMYDNIVRTAAKTHGMDENLIKAVIQTESSFRQEAVSDSGAQGLMQLKPGTAEGLGVINSFDATQNIMGGTAYLKKQMDHFGDIRLALAAYNTGPGAIARSTGAEDGSYDYNKLTEEERSYVDKVFSYYNAFCSMTE